MEKKKKTNGTHEATTNGSDSDSDSDSDSKSYIDSNSNSNMDSGNCYLEKYSDSKAINFVLMGPFTQFVSQYIKEKSKPIPTRLKLSCFGCKKVTVFIII